VSRWITSASRMFQPPSVCRISLDLIAVFFLSDIGYLYLNEKRNEKNEIQKIGEFLIDKAQALDCS
jgi:hypothetical protein